MITYNGFKPGESKTAEFKSKPKDAGHTMVVIKTTWTGGAFRFHYRITCECGRQFNTTSGNLGRALTRYNAHVRAARAMS